MSKKRTCRVCGCHQRNACITKAGPCHWVDKDLCSNPDCIANAAMDAIARYRASAGTAAFSKRGRNPLFPYVPVIHHAHDTRASVSGRTEQVRGFAYVTAAEAEAKAQEVIDGRVRWFAGQLCKRPCRALREQWGLPRELEITNGGVGFNDMHGLVA